MKDINDYFDNVDFEFDMDLNLLPKKTAVISICILLIIIVSIVVALIVL